MLHSLKSTEINLHRKTILALAVCAFSTPVLAWDVPSNLREVDDTLLWDSNAPSYNIYEDGVYIATVHNSNSFSDIFDNSLYQIVAHDHGVDFTSLSTGYLFIDDEIDAEPDDGEQREFSKTEVYYELNNTDGDLGIHASIDGDTWTQLAIEDLNGRKLLEIQLTGQLAKQGLTELFFESAEPTFDEVSPSEFFARFPGGIYDVEGVTLDGELIEGEALLSQVMPAAPVLYAGNGATTPNEGCEDDATDNPTAFLDADGSLSVVWDPVMSNHPEIGMSGDINVDGYEFVFESDSIKISVDLAPNSTSFTVPAELVSSGEEGNIEVLVRDDTHNQSATEACFNMI